MAHVNSVPRWACEVRSRCTAAKEQPRQLTVRPQAQHEAIQAARQRQETEMFKAQYALRAGVESSISLGVRRFDLRRSRYSGLARTHVQQTINATAMNLVRLADWFRKGKVDQRKRRPGHFARLAPLPQFGLAACFSVPGWLRPGGRFRPERLAQRIGQSRPMWLTLKE